MLERRTARGNLVRSMWEVSMVSNHSANSENTVAYAALRATLEWGSSLDLTDDQRKELEWFCCQIGGCVTRSLHVAERKKRQDAQQRANELEIALEANRQRRGWFRFP